MMDNLQKKPCVVLPETGAHQVIRLPPRSSASGMPDHKIDPVKHWWVVS